MDMSDDSESSSKSTDNSNEQSSDSGGTSKLLKYDNWVKGDDGKPQRRGPYGYESRDELEDTNVGELTGHEDLFKSNLPIFPHITTPPGYERGKRYDMSDMKTTVTCVSKTQAELRTINREIIMLDSGSTEKQDCMESLEQRFGTEVQPTTEVCLHMFAKMRHVVKMAMGGEFVDNWKLEDKDRVLKAVYGESWTQRFREKDTGERDLKHLDEIKEW